MSLTHLGKAALIALMLLFVFQALPAQDRQIELSSQGSQMRLLQNSDLGFTANYRIGKLSIKEIQTRGGVFDQLNIESYGHTTEIGEPQLPTQRQFIAVPVGAQVQLDVTHLSQRNLDASQSLLQNRVIPAQAPVSKSADPATITFELKEEAYGAASFRSRELFSVVDMGYLRGVRMFALDFYPVTYDPVANTLVVTEEASVQVRFNNADLGATQDLLAKTASMEYDALYNKVFFNWDANTRGNYMRHPTKYVILCPPAQAAQMQEFVDWKTQQGFHVILTTVGTGGTVANNSTAIKSYMQGLWDNATPSDPAPTYLLIVGDESGSIAVAPNSSTASPGGHITDQFYVRLNGNDYLPDMYWGRFSVSNTTELQSVIDKTVTFEKTAMADLSYLGKTILIAGVDSNWAPTHGNGAINYATSQYFTPDNGIDSDNYLYPASGQSADIIRTKANEGRGYINYTAHGSYTSWADPSFTTGHVNAMTNYDKYGVMIGNCCITNWFDYGSPCFGEAVIRKENAGGVVYIGGINSTYWNEDYDWAVGYKRPINGSAPAYNANTLGAYDAVAHSHGEAYDNWAMTVGDQIYMGNLAVQQSGSSRSDYYWEIYHIMGDPSLMPYMGVPTVNTATFPNTILIGAPSINITAAPHSRVALTKDGVIHASAMVPSSGTLTLPITPFTTVGNAKLVFTAQNKITRIENITVAPNAGPFVTIDALSYADNNNNIPEYNEAGRLNVTFKNVGNQTASNVTATLTCSTTGITITDNSETIASIGAGASIVRNNAFAFNIASNIPYGTVAMFKITMVSGSETWEHNFTLGINVPLISFGDYTISDPTGNNNGNLDPGETATFSITINNNGNATSATGFVVLSTFLAELSISPSQMSFPAIPASGSTSVDFTLTAASSINVGTLVTLTMEAGAGAYGLTRQVQLEIGAPDEIFIGSGTSTQAQPINRYYNYGGHEAIYLASELQAAGIIKSLAYYKASGADQNPIEAVKIYMKNTSDATLATGDYSTNGYTLVFDGSFTNNDSSGWMEVNLDTRFNYDGTNLAILIVKGHQAYTSSYPMWTYATSSTTRVRQNQNDQAQPTSLTSTNNLPNMRIKIFPAQGFLYPARELTANASSSRITLNWLAPISGNPTGYKIYRNNSLLTTVSTLTYTDTAVTNGTTYSYYVKAAYS
ncbi:MAG: gingipain R, partial [Candidatus Cloacimonetes bacterium]|nr:gingipain R [Candidatus Cloacimonadota bacterium]